ncbi:MAG TPA: PfkB family carbohydrate kinase [Candidatus Limnocylindrales bacterium]
MNDSAAPHPTVDGRRGPDIVVVGAAARDLARDDPRGWRLGGGVSYSALTTARLGLTTAALVGVDRLAAYAPELDLLREAGVDVQLVELDRGPVFENVDTPNGRIQLVFSRADPIAVANIPPAWRAARGWILAPIAGELGDDWATAMPDNALVGLGWQGLLRDLESSERVQRRPPGPSPLVARADLIGVSQDDVARDTELADLWRHVKPGSTLVLTKGDRGGLLIQPTPDGQPSIRRYPAIPPGRSVDPTGAGDVFLAALLAARVEPRLIRGRAAAGYDALLAAAVASLVLEGHGLLGVPDRDAVRRRMAEARQPA